MRKNVGTVDAFLRTTVGLYLFGHAIRNKHPFLMAMGAMETASGITRFCLMYKLFDISTLENPLSCYNAKKISKKFSNLT